MKPRKVIIQIEMLSEWNTKDLKDELMWVLEEHNFMGSDIEIRINVVKDTKKK